MARPHPVVCISTKLTDGRRRGTYHADITVHRFNKKIITVASVEGFQFQFGCRGYFDIFCFGKTIGYFLQVFGRQVIGAFGIFIYLQLFVDVWCDVQYTVNKSDLQSFARKFFIPVHCPKTICQVVVFHTTVLLDSTISTVVVSQY